MNCVGINGGKQTDMPLETAPRIETFKSKKRV